MKNRNGYGMIQKNKEKSQGRKGTGDVKMEIRRYQSSDLKEIETLFYQTVHRVNQADYREEQLDAWADGRIDENAWDRSFQEHITLVAVKDGRIAGFGDMDRTGYLDRLYVHWEEQRKGIASALCDRLEQEAESERFVTHASITAKPFFEKRGYRVVKEQEVIRKGVALTNYVMEKRGGFAGKIFLEGKDNDHL